MKLFHRVKKSWNNSEFISSRAIFLQDFIPVTLYYGKLSSFTMHFSKMFWFTKCCLKLDPGMAINHVFALLLDPRYVRPGINVNKYVKYDTTLCGILRFFTCSFGGNALNTQWDCHICYLCHLGSRTHFLIIECSSKISVTALRT